jgi:hypothetical protein
MRRGRSAAVVLAGVALLASSCGPSPTVTRVSVSTSGALGNASSSNPAVSDSGRFVVYYSDATNLVNGDSNGVRDTFFRDRTNGTTLRVMGPNQVQLDRASGSLPFEASYDGCWDTTLDVNPAISDDGRYVAFHSLARNAVPGVSPANATICGESVPTPHVFVKDRQAGTVELVDIGPSGGSGRPVYGIDMSADGRYVSFWRDDGLFVRDVVANSTRRANVTSSGAVIDVGYCFGGYDRGGSSCTKPSEFTPSISGDGRFVAFGARGGLLYLWDRTAGHAYQLPQARDDDYVEPEPTCYEDPPGTVAGCDTFWRVREYIEAPLVSADGRRVAYRLMATDCGDWYGGPQICGPTHVDTFVYDRATRETSTAPDRLTFGPTFSADGKVEAFATLDPRWVVDVFVRAYP